MIKKKSSPNRGSIDIVVINLVISAISICTMFVCTYVTESSFDLGANNPDQYMRGDITIVFLLPLHLLDNGITRACIK